MKLLRLALENFIAYRDRVEIPFEELLQEKLLLISGPTGSGKSALMDAILYGIFGKSKGDRSPVSQFNPDGVARVELEFSAGGKRCRVARAWKMKDGSLRTQSDDQQLQAIRRHYPFLQPQNSEIFRRVVVIPQGEYDHLIRSTPGKRYDLMKKLLPLERVETFTEILKAMYEESEEARNTILSSLRTLLESLTETALPEASDPLDYEDVLLSVKRKLEEERDQLRKEEDRLKKEQGEIEKDRKRLKALQKRVEALQSLEKALEKLLDLVQRKQEMETRRKTLHRLQEFAQTFQRPYDRLKQLEKDIPEKNKTQDRTLKHLEGLKKAYRELEPDFRKLPEMKERKEDLARKEGELKKQEETLRKLQKVLGDLERLSEDLAREEKVLKLFRAVYRLHLEGEHERLQKKLKELREQTDALDEQIREAYLARHLVELVESLEEGKPCPLCGSVHHPQPYAPPEETPSPKQLEKKKRHLEKAIQEYQQQLGAVEEKLKQVDPVDSSEEDILARARELGFSGGIENVYRELQKQYGDPQQMEKEGLRAREKKTRLEAERKTHNEHLDEPVDNAMDAHHKLKDIRERLKKVRGKKKALEKNIQDLEKKKQDLEGKIEKAQGILDTLKGELERLSEEREQLLNDLEHQLQHAQHHRTMEDLQRSSEEMDMIQGVQKEVSKWEKEWQSAITLRDQALQSLEETGDLAELRGVMEMARTAETFEDLDRALRATRERRAREEQQAHDLEQNVSGREEEWRRASEELNQKIGKLDERESQIRRGEEALSGWKEQRHRHETLTALMKHMVNNKQFVYWVTRHYLGRMLRHASEYLRAFSNDRYTFVTNTGDEKSIPLIVHDSFTGEQRDTRHLSGGEQFMASLALALGMSRTLVEMQGSDAPGFLFIDEGFGTLDSETLIQVAQILRDHAHREDVDLIVISHRKELRDYFPVVLEVVPSSTGSTVR